MLTRRSLAIGMSLTAGLGVAQADTTRDSLPDAIRFGAFGAGFGQPYGVALYGIAQGKGFVAREFEGTPVKLEWTYLAGTGPAVNEAIANGQIDVAQYGALPNVIGRANGLPTRVLMCYGPTTIFGAARPDAGIASVKDLRGKRVTFQKGTILHWAFQRALQANGLTPRDVTIVDLKTSDQLAALAAGAVDASIGSSSVLSLVDRKAATIFYTSKDVGPKATGFGGIIGSDTFLIKYPEAARRVMRGLVRAAEWISKEENRDEALQVWSKSGTPVGALREEFSGVTMKDAFNPLIDDFLASQYRDVIEFSKSERLIRSDIDLAKWLDPSPLNTALAELGLDGYWSKRDPDGRPLG